MDSSRRLALAFGCLWDEIPETTWSSTPWSLRAALREQADIIDVGVEVAPSVRFALKALHARRYAGRLTSTWEYARLTDAYVERSLCRQLADVVASHGCDAALTIQDMSALPVPFFMYQDLSYDALIAAKERLDQRAGLLSISPATVARRRERQLAIYEQASGIMAMSRWFARSLVEQTGVAAKKVHVVHPGITGLAAPPHDEARAGEPDHGRAPHSPEPGRRGRLLFVGRDFYRKGGDIVVEALAILRRDFDPEVVLTIVGPRTWPLPDDPPPGVRFLGRRPAAEVTELYASHDLFVMPSRFEPFGLVFAEAISHGLPCVARDAFAMPEIVVPGQSGSLVTSDDPAALAAAIASALGDDALHAACRAGAPEAASYFSWQRSARDILGVIAGTLSIGSQDRRMPFADRVALGGQAAGETR
jgi:glycosyltransferase involved in cell wall biosynthesis